MDEIFDENLPDSLRRFSFIILEHNMFVQDIILNERDNLPTLKSMTQIYDYSTPYLVLRLNERFEMEVKKFLIIATAVGSASIVFSLSINQMIIVSTVTLMASYLLSPADQKGKLPPGPTGIVDQLQTTVRIFKMVMFSGSEVDYQFEPSLEQARRYGPILTMPVGNTNFISITDYETMKEFALIPEFQLRPDRGVLLEMTKGYGLIASEGDLWKHQRRFVLHALRDAGMGKLRMQEKIGNELQKVVCEIERSSGQPIFLQSLLEKSTSNIIFSIAFNKHFDYDDRQFIERIEALDENFKLMVTTSILTFYPWLTPIFGSHRRRLLNNVELLKKQSQEFIDEHRRTLDVDDPRDLLDLYLIEMDKNADDSGYYATFTDEQLQFLIMDLFAGGTETSSTTIRWALLYMILHPDVQKKVQHELDEVIGTEQQPRIEDKPNLPYTVATLQEVERLASVVPLALPRSNQRPYEFLGYALPARSMVNFNLYAIHHDPRMWPNSERFDPSRFIDADGKAFRPPQLSPFGSGKRACPGEALARMEIFLYFTTLMQHFRFECPKNKPKPKIILNFGALRSPREYEICCYPRT